MDKPTLPDTPAEINAAAVAIRQRFAAVSSFAARELVQAVTRTIGSLGCKSADELLARAVDLRQQLNLPLTAGQVSEALLYVLFERWPHDAADAAHLTAALAHSSGGPVGGTADQVPSGRGPFGRALGNPVPVAGIVAERFYLNRLRTAAGLPVSWRRLGSQRGADGPVDCYELTDFLGERAGQVYLDPYHQHTSGLAPDGLTLLPHEPS